jgi:predicted aldo/keto reductase-like oxidoreductase
MNIKLNRRKFLKHTSIGLLGAGVFGNINISASSDNSKTELHGKLVYRTMGKTGIRVPVIGMGILGSGSPALIKAALDTGINHFDSTADPLQQKRNEAMLGEVLKGRPRESFIYGTKIHLPQDYKTGLYEKAATEKEFTRMLDAALKNLHMNYVDILYHHMVSRRESAFYEPVLKAMEKARKNGKARFLGLTSHGNVPEAVNAAVDTGFYEVVMAAYNPRQTDRLQVQEAIENASRAGLGVVAIKIIRGGFEEGQRPINPAASLKWVLQDKNVHATVPGFSNFDEMNTDLSVMNDLSLTGPESDDLKLETSFPGLYCQGCSQCIRQCKDELPVPDLMRAYMYTFGYKQPSLGQNLINSLKLPQILCSNCSSCGIICRNGWKISEKIYDLIRKST